MRSVLLALSALVVSSGAVAAPAFSDSFESVVLPGSQIFQNFTAGSSFGGWTVGGLSVDVVNGAGISVPASNGAQAVDLFGIGPGSISRVVTLVPGQAYSLTFDYRANFNDVAPPAALGGQYLAQVSVGQELPRTFGITESDARAGWKSSTINFTTTTAQTVLSFTGLVGGGAFYGGVMIDNVTVAAVPEPHEWAMMLAGLGLVGWAARRKRPDAAAMPA